MCKFWLSAFSDEAASDLTGQITALKNNNLRFTELRNVDGKCIIDHPTSNIKEIRRQLDGNGIGVSAIGSPIGKFPITEPLVAHLDAFSRTIEAAHLLGTKRIRIFSFFIPLGHSPDDYRQEVLSRIHELLTIAQKEDIICCHENEKEIYGDTADRNVELFKSFGGRLKLIFDPANYIQCGEKPEEIFSRLLPCLDYMHIKDAQLSDGAVVPAGMGDGNIAQLINGYSSAEDKLLLTIEPHLTVFEGLSQLQTEAVKHKFTYDNPTTAFDAAVAALKQILDDGGYDYE